MLRSITSSSYVGSVRKCSLNGQEGSEACMLGQLFIVFVKIGLLSFGGGYAVIPMIQHEMMSRGWIGDEALRSIVTIAGMAPGPVATNSATLIGYELAGLSGAILATLGMILPSLCIVIVLSAFFYRFHNTKWVRSSFYGLRPIITGFIVYAAIHFILPSGWGDALTWKTLATMLISAGCVYAVIKHHLHPIAVIGVSAMIGIVIF